MAAAAAVTGGTLASGAKMARVTATTRTVAGWPNRAERGEAAGGGGCGRDGVNQTVGGGQSLLGPKQHQWQRRGEDLADVRDVEPSEGFLAVERGESGGRDRDPVTR